MAELNEKQKKAIDVFRKHALKIKVERHNAPAHITMHEREPELFVMTIRGATPQEQDDLIDAMHTLTDRAIKRSDKIDMAARVRKEEAYFQKTSDGLVVFGTLSGPCHLHEPLTELLTTLDQHQVPYTRGTPALER